MKIPVRCSNMSLLLDALKQAEENKKKTPDPAPTDDSSGLSLENLDGDHETEASDAVSITEHVETYQETSPSEEIVVSEPDVISDQMQEEALSAELLELTAEQIPVATPTPAPAPEKQQIEVEVVAPQVINEQVSPPDQPVKATLDPALNIFSVGSGKATKAGGSKRVLLLLLLCIVIFMAMLLIYLWLSQQQPAPGFADDRLQEILETEEFLQEAPRLPTVVAAALIEAQQAVLAKPEVKGVTADSGQASAVLQPANSSEDNEQIRVVPKQIIEIRKRTLSSQVSERLSRAYDALATGKYTQAKTDYETVLAERPKQVDALLGLAKIYSHENNPLAARQLYEKVLRNDESIAVAQLGLLHTYQDESSFEKVNLLQDLSEKYPQSSQIAVARGHELAKQNRWPEAQNAYFQAFSLSPQNAAYAYNLAISLDEMEKYGAAKQYYKEALLLNQKTSTLLDIAPLQQRLLQLGE